MDDADDVYVSVISFYEIAQKARLGKWPTIEPVVADLPRALERQGGKILDINTGISLRAGLFDWDHRDPFDRMLAATALEMDLPLMSADIAFYELADRQAWPGRVW